MNPPDSEALLHELRSSIKNVNTAEFAYRYLPEFKWLLPWSKIDQNNVVLIESAIATPEALELNANSVSGEWWDNVGSPNYIYEIPSAASPINLMHLANHARKAQDNGVPFQTFINNHVFVSVPSTPVKWKINNYAALLYYINMVHEQMLSYPYSLWAALKYLRKLIAVPVIKGGTKGNAISAAKLFCQCRGELVMYMGREPRLSELAAYGRSKLQALMNNMGQQCDDMVGGATVSEAAVGSTLGFNLPLLVIMESVSVLLQVVLSHFLALAIGAKELPPFSAELKGGGVVYGPDGSTPINAFSRPARTSGHKLIQLIGGQYGAPRDWLTNEQIDIILNIYCKNINSRFHFYPTNYCDRLDAFIKGIQTHAEDRHFIIVNTATHGSPGEHWIAVGYDSGVLLEYDSGASNLPDALLEALKPLIKHVRHIKVSLFSSQTSNTECGIYCLLMGAFYHLNKEDMYLALPVPDSICYEMRTRWYHHKFFQHVQQFLT